MTGNPLSKEPALSLAAVEDTLEEMAERHGLDWGIKCEVAHECCWSVELRITLEPNNQAGPDRSLVFYTAGAADPQEGVSRVYCDARNELPWLAWGL